MFWGVFIWEIPIKTFAEFPMRQKPAKFNVDDVMKLMTEGSGN